MAVRSNSIYAEMQHIFSVVPVHFDCRKSSTRDRIDNVKVLKSLVLCSVMIFLAGCSHTHTSEPGSLTIQSSETVQSAEAPESSRAAHPQSASCENSTEVGQKLDVIARLSPSALAESPTGAADRIINPLMNRDIRGMKWVTLFGLGGVIDPCSVSIIDDSFTASIVDENGNLLATVNGFYLNSTIIPSTYRETPAGSQFRKDHRSVSESWPA